ncbi:MAG TPA: hypothetical protein VFQ80_18980 [Thermomicrobiales bacterium]|nr:hypothetical protein [Thermomicrobiales bacterium]
MPLRIGEAETNQAVGERLRPVDWWPTALAAFLSAAAAALLIASFSHVSVLERGLVVASMIDGVRWLASAAIGACATIAALTLTTLGLLDVFERRGFGPRFLLHMRLTVVGAFAVIAVAVAALLVSLFPTATGGEPHPDPREVEIVYDALLMLIALIVGGLAVVLTSLYATIAEVFRNLPHGWVRDILSDDASPAAAAPTRRRESESA